ncbi:hypothetical protein DL771_003369 [Monosporascus sp. 5C6A]|nr:hypothetical protein DL771_003369 [Monosporascus sp. 5C6A]
MDSNDSENRDAQGAKLKRDLSVAIDLSYDRLLSSWDEEISQHSRFLTEKKRSDYLFRLAICRSNEGDRAFSVTDNSQDDIESNIQLYRRILDYSYEGPGRRGTLETLLALYSARYSISDDIDDLEEGISFGREAVSYMREEPEMLAPLFNLGVLLGQRYEISRFPEDLEESISLINWSVSAETDQGLAWVMGTCFLGAALYKRYALTGHKEDLESAISTMRRGMAAIPSHMSDYHLDMVRRLLPMIKERDKEKDNGNEYKSGEDEDDDGMDIFREISKKIPSAEAYMERLSRTSQVTELQDFLQGLGTGGATLPTSGSQESFVLEQWGDLLGHSNRTRVRLGKSGAFLLIERPRDGHVGTVEAFSIDKPEDLEKAVEGSLGKIKDSGEGRDAGVDIMPEHSDLEDIWTDTIDNSFALNFFGTPNRFRSAGKMGTYYNWSYATLAATSARDSAEGFIHTRPPRGCVSVGRDASGNQIYVCDAIDNFQEDVIDGLLNSRAWVLQERALSRRIIHFTANQTYWECAEGISPKASFFSDPQFPECLGRRNKSERVRLFQYLFATYSSRALTHVTDRPVAISGLLERLSDYLGTDTRYGIVERYLHRSLIWRSARGSGRLKRISFGDKRKKRVPSWSWMAYDGEIDYIEIMFYGKVEWSDVILYATHCPDPTDAKTSTRAAQRTSNDRSDNDDVDVKLKDLARKFSIDLKAQDGVELTFDEVDDNKLDVQRLRCVVLGRVPTRKGNKKDGQHGHPADLTNGTSEVITEGPKNELTTEGPTTEDGLVPYILPPAQATAEDMRDDQVNFVLLIMPVEGRGEHMYERVGIGSVMRWHILSEPSGSAEDVWII